MQLLSALIGFFIGKKNWQRKNEIAKLIKAEEEKKLKEKQDDNDKNRSNDNKEEPKRGENN